MLNFQDKVAFVTGGSSGIGRAAALVFAKAGAKVAVVNRTEETGLAVVEEIMTAGGQAIWIGADVSIEEEVAKAVTKTVETYGKLNCAFNNGGSGGMGGWITEIESGEWDKTINGFLKSVWLCMKYQIPAMIENGGGAIVNMSSVDGKRAFPWDPVYSAAKHGVIGLTKSAALQYLEKNVRINAVCPGWIKTPPIEGILERDPGAAEGMLRHQPIGRFGTPEEVAQAVLWLCSDAASLIAGTALDVDGGYLAV